MAAQRPRKSKLGLRHALARRISPKQASDARPSKHQEEALTKLANKAKQLLRPRALFSGPSGTSKTLAVEFLARELKVTLYRIDLRAVVSKYIGEPEKNLRRLVGKAEIQVRFCSLTRRTRFSVSVVRSRTATTVMPIAH